MAFSLGCNHCSPDQCVEIICEPTECCDDVVETVNDLISVPLSVDGAVLVSLLNNPSLQATLEDVGIARADLIQVGLLSNPVLGAGVGWPSKSGFAITSEFSIVQSFLDICLIPLRLKVARVSLLQSELKVSQAVMHLVTDVKRTWYTLEALQPAIDTQRQIVQLRQVESQLSTLQYQAGNVAQIEFTSRMQRLEEEKLALNRLLEDEAKQIAQLQMLMGLSDTNCWVISTSSSRELPREVDLCEFIQLALQNRVDIEIARLEVCRIGYELGLAHPLVYIDPKIGFLTVHEVENVQTTGPMVQFALPIFDFGQARRLRLQAEYRQAVWRLRETETTVIANVSAAWKRESLARRAWLATRESLQPLLVETVKLAQLQYNAMALGVYDLLASKEAEISGMLNLANARRDYFVALTELEEAIGIESSCW